MAPKTAVNKRAAQVLAKVYESVAALLAAGGSLDDKVDEGDSSHTVLETPAKKPNVSESSAALPAAGGSLDKVDEADSSESEGCIIEDVTYEVFVGYCRAPNSDAHPHRPYFMFPGERLVRCRHCTKFFEHMRNPKR